MVGDSGLTSYGSVASKGFGAERARCGVASGSLRAGAYGLRFDSDHPSLSSCVEGMASVVELL